MWGVSVRNVYMPEGEPGGATTEVHETTDANSIKVVIVSVGNVSKCEDVWGQMYESPGVKGMGSRF